MSAFDFAGSLARDEGPRWTYEAKPRGRGGFAGLARADDGRPPMLCPHRHRYEDRARLCAEVMARGS